MKNINKASTHTRILSLLCASACLLSLFTLSSCSVFSRDEKFTAEYFDYFDTYSKITVYADSEEDFERYESIARSTLEEYHRLFDIYHEYDGITNLATINSKAGRSWEEADIKLIEAVQFGIDAYFETEGHTNIAMGSVIALWNKAFDDFAKDGSATLPTREELDTALRKSDINTIKINSARTKIFIADQDTSINMGAVAKGYVADKLFDLLKAAGCRSFLIDLGGNIQSYGLKPDSSPWLGEIYDPTTKGSLTAEPFPLRNLTVVTSGAYQRYITVDGKDYCHILNVENGMPADTFASVSVIAVSGYSALADALSTALFTMSFEDGFELVESFADVEAVWIYPDGTVRESENFRVMTSQK